MWDGPVVTDSTLIGGDLDGKVFALRLENGSELWTFQTEGPVVGRPALGDLTDEGQTIPVVYVNSGDTHVYMLRVSDGREAAPAVAITAEFVSRFLFVNTGSSQRAIPLYAAPVLLDDLVLIGAHQGTIPLYALDRDRLVERWTFDPTDG
jgi:outer membrane protein assembly factor BamB